GSDSDNFPVTAGAFQTTHRGRNDAFVAKLNASGTALLYSTFIGGFQSDIGTAISVDRSGNAYVTGYTFDTGIADSNYPVTGGSYQTLHRGANDVFVTKLNPSGSALLYSTFVGGASSEASYGIAVDSNGNACVAGFTTDAG